MRQIHSGMTSGSQQPVSISTSFAADQIWLDRVEPGLEKTQNSFMISSPGCGSDCSSLSEQRINDHKMQSGTDQVASTNLCSFNVGWSINAHMKVGAVNVNEALMEHKRFRGELENSGACVYELPFVHGAYDSVFVKDNAVLAQHGEGRRALLANPKCAQRKPEQRARRLALEKLGFEIWGTAKETFEGGDLVVNPFGTTFLGYGFRSRKDAEHQISEFLESEVVTLELVDPYFYHLDTALAVLEDGSAFAYRGAFAEESWKKLKSSHGIQSLTEVSRKEAMKFALNWVEVGDTIVIGSYVPQVIWDLQSLGKKVRISPLQQFQLAGGSAACLTAKIHQLSALDNRLEQRPELGPAFGSGHERGPTTGTH